MNHWRRLSGTYPEWPTVVGNESNFPSCTTKSTMYDFLDVSYFEVFFRYNGLHAHEDFKAQRLVFTFDCNKANVN